jgi:hypothetical protein
VWIQGAIMLTNVSMHTSSLDFSLGSFVIVLAKNNNGMQCLPKMPMCSKSKLQGIPSWSWKKSFEGEAYCVGPAIVKTGPTFQSTKFYAIKNGFNCGLFYSWSDYEK